MDVLNSPDRGGGVHGQEGRRWSTSALPRLGGFVLAYVLLYALVNASEAVPRWFIESVTVPSATWAVNLVHDLPTPARAAGSRIVAEGGGLNVLQGCEGLDVLGLWLAAMVSAPLSLRGRVLGATVGTAVVFVFNQIRLVSLFGLHRHGREWFDDAHGLWWPVILVLLVYGLFVLWQHWFTPPPCTAAAA